MCLLTGEEGDVEKKEVELSYWPFGIDSGALVFFFLAFFYQVGGFMVGFIVLVALAMLLGKSASLVYFVTAEARRVSVKENWVLWGVSFLFGVAVTLTTYEHWSDDESLSEQLIFSWIVTFLFRALLGFFYRRRKCLCLRRVKDGVGEYRRVSPIALRRLEQWRVAHLKSSETE